MRRIPPPRPAPAVADGQCARPQMGSAGPSFCSAPKTHAAAIRLLSALARLDISSPRELGGSLGFRQGVAMSSQKNGVAVFDKNKSYRPTDKERFMNERQREYFRLKLLTWKDEILKEARDTMA